jgi:hypothetical protein
MHIIWLTSNQEDEMKKQIEWNLQNGSKATYAIELRLSKIVSLDGDKMSIPCCEIERSMTIEGSGYLSEIISKLDKPRTVNGKTAIAAIGGKVGIDAETYHNIMSAIAEVEAAPEYISKLAEIKKNQTEIAKMEAARRKNGYCEKCGSYCYGDCEAN